MPDSNTPKASAVVTRDSLIVQYPTEDSALGTLWDFGINDDHYGGKNKDNVLLIQKRSFLTHVPSSGRDIISPSIVQSASLSYTYMDNYYLALNIKHSGPLPPPPPLLFNLDFNYGAPNEPEKSWYAKEDRLLSANATGVSIAPGTGHGDRFQGSAMLQAQAMNDGSTMVRKINFESVNMRIDFQEEWSSIIPYFDPMRETKIINSVELSSDMDGAVVGKCKDSAWTCLVWLDKGRQFSDQLLPEMETTDVSYSPSNCYALAANKTMLIVDNEKTTNFQKETRPSINETSVRSVAGLEDPILACAVSGSTLYAVLQGGRNLPRIFTLDLHNANPSWSATILQEKDLGLESDNRGSTLRNIIIPTVLAVVILILVFLGCIWRRRRGPKDPFRGTNVIPGEPVVLSRSISPLGPSSSSGPTYFQPPTSSASGSGAPVTYVAMHTIGSNNNNNNGSNTITLNDRISYPTSAAGIPEFHIIHVPDPHLPMIASSLSVAPYRPFPMSSVGPPVSSLGATSPSLAPVVPLGSPRTSVAYTSGNAGPKQEVTEDRSRAGPSSSFAGSSSSSSGGPPPSSSSIPPSSSHLHQNSALGFLNDQSSVGMLSPAMANAQLILQQSQTPSSLSSSAPPTSSS